MGTTQKAFLSRKNKMARVKEGCDCGCNDPVATTPEGMLRFLKGRMEFAGVSDSVARLYAEDIGLILDEYFSEKDKE